MKRAPFFLVLAIAAILYGWLLGVRWITPDEGAHLMDGRRILLDHVPVVDYAARMPLYCYILAASQAVFGHTLFAGRIVPLLATLLAGALVYRIAGRAGGEGTGTLGAILLLFSPLTIHYATVVQTQPLVMVFSLLAVAAAIRGGPLLFFAAGLSIGCAFYVRESALAALLALALFSLLYGGKRGLLRELFPLLGGFATLTALVALFYLRFMSPAEWWWSRLNPLAMPMEAARGVFTAASEAVSAPAYAAGLSGIRSGHSRPPSVEYLVVGFRFLLLPILAGVAGAVRGVRPVGEGEGEGEEGGVRRVVRVAALWLFTVALFYLYWFLVRGFYPGYFREFEPPLAVLGAIGVSRAFREAPPPTSAVVFAAASVTGALLIQGEVLPFWIEDYTLALASAVGFFFLSIRGDLGRGRWAAAAAGAAFILFLFFLLRRPPDGALRIGPYAGLLTGLLFLGGAWIVARTLDVRRVGARLLLALALFGLVYSAVYARNRGGVRFHAEWSPAVVERVGREVADHSDWGETVLSGAVIWEYLADRRPFHGIDHPLSLQSQEPYNERHLEVFEIFRRKPPAVVVIDGQTEKTYFRAPGLEALIRSTWAQTLRIDGPTPVEVWVRPPDADPPAPSSLSGATETPGTR
ncbi:MAG: glycosyltransferase family 39 protein [Candidatus Eisenbacteria bacterium]|nr:glycosyltransferase family 39 protein [Candidatus Eisenbacteria bacterium]